MKFGINYILSFGQISKIKEMLSFVGRTWGYISELTSFDRLFLLLSHYNNRTSTGSILVEENSDGAAFSVKLKDLSIFSRKLAFDVRITWIIVNFAYG